ncbi:MAG: hypothetical protein QM536_01245 [Chitinophagaceae bacterium]|nr:hypothetical protein [Chitinophagaceae bacterium]
MENKQIKFIMKVGNKELPLSIPLEKESFFKKASLELDTLFETLRKEYPISPEHDIICFMAYHLMIEKLKNQEIIDENEQFLQTKTSTFHSLLEDFIKTKHKI